MKNIILNTNQNIEIKTAFLLLASCLLIFFRAQRVCDRGKLWTALKRRVSVWKILAVATGPCLSAARGHVTGFPSV